MSHDHDHIHHNDDDDVNNYCWNVWMILLKCSDFYAEMNIFSFFDYFFHSHSHQKIFVALLFLNWFDSDFGFFDHLHSVSSYHHLYYL